MPTRTISQTIDLTNASEPVSKYITQINEYGISIHPNEIVLDNLYVETTDAVCDIDKTYYYISNNQYVKLNNSYFEDNVTYYERLVNYSMQLDGHGLEFLQNNYSTAYYGDKVRIGDKNGFHILMTDQRLSFYDGNNEVAYISDDQLYITKSVVLQQMEVGTPLNNNNELGQWGWKVRQNENGQNNLQLKWLG